MNRRGILDARKGNWGEGETWVERAGGKIKLRPK